MSSEPWRRRVVVRHYPPCPGSWLIDRGQDATPGASSPQHVVLQSQRFIGDGFNTLQKVVFLAAVVGVVIMFVRPRMRGAVPEQPKYPA